MEVKNIPKVSFTHTLLLQLKKDFILEVPMLTLGQFTMYCNWDFLWFYSVSSEEN